PRRRLPVPTRRRRQALQSPPLRLAAAPSPHRAASKPPPRPPMPATESPLDPAKAAPDLAGPANARPLPAPTVKRRVTAMVYEFFVLFAVEMLAVLSYLLLSGDRQEPVSQYGLKLYLFLVTGLYFTWC